MKKINIKLKQTPKVKEFNKILKKMSNKHTDGERELREKLAELAHSQWSGWMEWMLKNLDDVHIKNWKRQMNTPYDKLSEREKDSDRKEADKYLQVLQKAIQTTRLETVREVEGKIKGYILMPMNYTEDLLNFLDKLKSLKEK